jgi:4-amino-4-deoxy-L-arabinose transferase-like glycosyltransferase
MFGAEVGGQVAWLLPAALLLLLGGLVAVGRAPRTDRRRATLLLWGGWLVTTALVFSLMAGIFHAYYTVALAPAIAAVVGIGGTLLWGRRDAAWARIVLAVTLAGTAVWSWVLLSRSADFLPWLRWLIVIAGVLGALGLLVVDRAGRGIVAAVLAVGVVAGLGGPAAYALQTAGSAHTGSIVTAGPTVAGANGFGGGPRGGFRGAPPAGFAGRGGPPAGFGGGGFGEGGFGGGGVPGGRGGMGGLLDARTVSSPVAAALEKNASSYTWVAATVGANNAAGYQLATQLPVMPIGGFNGSDPSPTPAQFQADVASGQIHWFIGGAREMGSAGGSNASSSIASWVASHYTAQTIGGVRMYDLSSPVG